MFVCRDRTPKRVREFCLKYELIQTSRTVSASSEVAFEMSGRPIAIGGM
jgi:hypothetical protein